VEDIASLRKELSLLSRRGSTRNNAWTREVPCDWSPGTVENPVTGMPFTETSAWELICDLLDGDQEFTTVILDVPPGHTALVAKVVLAVGKPLLYIKLHKFRGKSLCRSFHPDLRKG
jgi:hypothetical protein